MFFSIAGKHLLQSTKYRMQNNSGKTQRVSSKAISFDFSDRSLITEPGEHNIDVMQLQLRLSSYNF